MHLVAARLNFIWGSGFVLLGYSLFSSLICSLADKQGSLGPAFDPLDLRRQLTVLVDLKYFVWLTTGSSSGGTPDRSTPSAAQCSFQGRLFGPPLCRDACSVHPCLTLRLGFACPNWLQNLWPPVLNTAYLHIIHSPLFFILGFIMGLSLRTQRKTQWQFADPYLFDSHTMVEGMWFA